MWNVDFKIGKSDNCAGGINMLVICNSIIFVFITSLSIDGMKCLYHWVNE